VSLPNSNGGIVILNAPNNIIGGTTPNERNIISGNGFQGINISGNDATGNQIYGNYIGTDITGTVAIPNSFYGILISSNASNTIIGGTGEGEGNLISGNSSNGVYLETGTNNQVIGNIIGTDISGKNALGNGGLAGVRIDTSDNTIADNLVSGNTSDGILISSSNANNNTVIGNLVGTDIDGIETLGNGEAGIVIAQTATNNKIGGTTPEERNIISGNNSSGVSFQFNATNNQVLGNYIGTNINGTVEIGNGGDGISLLAAPNNIIGGTIAGSGNCISGNNGNGIDLGLDSSESQILGNFIGTDVSGTVAIPNDEDGISTDAFPANSIIGGTTPTERNLISGNGGNGIYIDAPNYQIFGNFIGTQIDGMSPLGNTGRGIDIALGGVNTRIGGTNTGEGNTIAFNSGDGVFVGNGSTGNAILSNSIFSNGELGIDLNAPSINDAGTTANDEGDADAGSNNLQNFPVITSAIYDGTNLTISGTLNSTPNTTFRVEFFLNNTLDFTTFGEGEQFLGFANLTTDESGNVGFEEILSSSLTENQFITATATDPNNNTSEFSGGTEVNPVTTVEFYQGNYQLNEDGTVVGSAITINRTGNTATSSSVEVQLTDGTANGGTSLDPGIDFNNTTILVNFASGETFQTLTVPINDDTLLEDNETLTLTLLNGSLGTIINPQNTATLEIIDNDEPEPTPTPGEPTPTPTPAEPTPTPTEPTPTPTPEPEPIPTREPEDPDCLCPSFPSLPNIRLTKPTNVISGQEQNEALLGTEENDFLEGLGGNDTLTALEGNDTLVGGIENDILFGNKNSDLLLGENGEDTLYGGKEDDLIFGNEGNDLMFGDEENDSLLGGEGNDTLLGGANQSSDSSEDGQDLLFGNEGNDLILGNKENDSLSGGDGSDTLYGGKNNDLIFGDLGRDLLFGDCRSSGTGEANRGNDTLCGGEENDTLYGNFSSQPDIRSVDEEDFLCGDEGNDILFGNEGNDTLNGGSDHDILYGGTNNDSLVGGAGDDTLFGEEGDNILVGGTGNDRFGIFVNTGKNTILDFQDNQDKILVYLNENLANFIAFEELLITQDGNNTLIKFQEKVLVTLEEIDATFITSEDFFFVNR